MHPPDDGPTPDHRSPLVLWLSVAQLVSWGCVFYGFSLLMEPVEAALGMSRAQLLRTAPASLPQHARQRRAALRGSARAPALLDRG